MEMNRQKTNIKTLAPHWKKNTVFQRTYFMSTKYFVIGNKAIKGNGGLPSQYLQNLPRIPLPERNYTYTLHVLTA